MVDEFWVDDYLNRSVRTVLANLRKDRIGSVNASVLLDAEVKNKNRKGVVDFLGKLVDVHVTGAKDEENVEDDSMNKKVEDKFVMCVWKKSNHLNGVTIHWKGIDKTFRKGIPVKITQKEKGLLEERYTNCFDFKSVEDYQKFLDEKQKKADKKKE